MATEQVTVKFSDWTSHRAIQRIIYSWRDVQNNLKIETLWYPLVFLCQKKKFSHIRKAPLNLLHVEGWCTVQRANNKGHVASSLVQPLKTLWRLGHPGFPSGFPTYICIYVSMHAIWIPAGTSSHNNNVTLVLLPVWAVCASGGQQRRRITVFIYRGVVVTRIASTCSELILYNLNAVASCAWYCISVLYKQCYGK